MNLFIKILIKIFKKNVYKYFLTQKILFNSKLIKRDYLYNKNIFTKLNLDFEKTLNKISQIKYDFNIFQTSFHYNLFLAISEKKDNLKILEIGTYRGEFTNFLSLIFPKSKIVSIDLSEEEFTQIMGGSTNYNYNEINKIRQKNINKNNINYFEMNSNNLLKKFKENTFDIIWIDGDHLDPQVSIDIKNSIKLCKNKGIICCDDIIKTNYKNKLTDNASYKTLNKLKNLETYYLLKRIRYISDEYKKYISYSYVNK